MDENNNIKQSPNVPPFVRYCSAIIPTAFDDSLSYYEALCALWKWLQDNVVNVINNNATVTDEYIKLVKELEKYVHDYFDNLDVQEEINNKLDAMAEDGTLASLFQYEEYSPFTVKNIHDLVYADSDTYLGGDHGSAQGSVVVGDSVIVALRNYLYLDDYVRLVEYDYTTNTIVREKYLELEHANAMTYDETNGLIYVAACSKVNSDNTGTEDSNRIYVLDYTTLSIQSSFVPTNIPVGGRIRSVTYDNDRNKLFAGDVTSIYEIDLTTQAVVDTIDLETDGVDTTITNQTYTYLNNKFYGLFLTYIAVWDLDGKLLKVLPFLDINEGKFGEPESISFKDNGDFIFVTAKRYNPRQSVRVASLYKGNIYNGIDNVLVTEVAGADTSNITIYVDADYTGEELGTSDKPFKDIAKAVAFAKSWNKGTDIKVAGGTYNYVYLNQVTNIVLDATEAGVVINGLELRASDLTILHGSRITINYLYLTQHSNLIASDITVNQSTAGTGNAIKIENSSTAKLDSITVTGSNNADLIVVDGLCDVSFRSPTLSGYTGYYALYITSFSTVAFYNPILSDNDTTHEAVYINAQCVCKVDPREMQSSSMFKLAGQAQKSPSLLEVTLDSPIYNGEICALNYAFTSAQLKVKLAGANTAYQNFDVDLLEAAGANGIRFATVYPSSGGIRVGSLAIKVANNKISVLNPSMGYMASGGTYTHEDITTQTGTNYPAVAGIKFFNK